MLTRTMLELYAKKVRLSFFSVRVLGLNLKCGIVFLSHPDALIGLSPIRHWFDEVVGDLTK